MISEGSSDSEDSWVQWFCARPGHEFFCEVDRAYIEDAFNLYGLKEEVPNYNRALALILDKSGDDAPSAEIAKAAGHLYGLIHARYILTAHGLDAMRTKYLRQEFGECPRVYCQGQAVVPMGTCADPNLDVVRVFCPRCEEIYSCNQPNHVYLDGAYFGPTFPHLFFISFEDLVPPPPAFKYVPRIFGFKVHSSSKSLSSNKQQAATNGSPNKRQLEANTGTTNSAGSTVAHPEDPPAAPSAAMNGKRARREAL